MDELPILGTSELRVYSITVLATCVGKTQGPRLAPGPVAPSQGPRLAPGPVAPTQGPRLAPGPVAPTAV